MTHLERSGSLLLRVRGLDEWQRVCTCESDTPSSTLGMETNTAMVARAVVSPTVEIALRTERGGESALESKKIKKGGGVEDEVGCLPTLGIAVKCQAICEHVFKPFPLCNWSTLERRSINSFVENVFPHGVWMMMNGYADEDIIDSEVGLLMVDYKCKRHSWLFEP